MKKHFTFLSVITVAVLLASCTVEFENYQAGPVPSPKTITLTVDAEVECDDSGDTKTVVDGSTIKWSTSGEKISVYEKATTAGDVAMVSKASNVGSTTDSYVTMSFSVSLAEKTADNFTYYGSYPSSANVSTNSTQAKANLETKNAQTPSASSFDPSADLMISKSVDNDDEQATSLSMQFARVVAIGKMTITNLPVDEYISKVSFSANDGSAVTLAGRTNYDLDTATPVTDYGDALAKTEIDLNVSALSAKAYSSSMDVWFTCYPFELGEGNSFTVVVEAGPYQVSRTVTIPSARSLAFTAGKVSRFSVNMSAGDVAMQQPWVLYSGAFTAGDYLIVSSNQAMIAGITSDRFQYTGVTANANGEIFTNRTDVVWRAAASSTYWTLYNPETEMYAASTGADKKAKLLDDGSDDMSLWSVSGDGAYEFVNKYNNDKPTTYKYLRYNPNNGWACYTTSTGSASLLYKKDSRPYLATPASVIAAINGSDDSIIDVTFGTVANAGTYVIVATPTAGDDVVKEGVTSSPATISVADGLAYATTYSISVYAVPSVPESYRTSLSKKASGTVTTGEAPPASIGTTLWLEPFKGYTNSIAPTASNANTTVYTGGTLTYACTVSGTQIYASDNNAEGAEAGELLIKNDGTFTVTGAPTGDATALTLSFKSNNGCTPTTTTTGASISSNLGSGKSFIYSVSVKDGTKTLNLVFTNSTGSNTRIDDIKLLAGAPTAATPVIGFENNTVSITCATGGVSIYYTVDGSTPDSGETLYSSPFELTSEKTIKAIAIKDGINDSEVAELLCTPKVATPVISSSANAFTITCATAGATIYYETSTVNLASVATPTTSSSAYSAKVNYAATTYVKAYAVKDGYTDSDEASATCTYSSGTDYSTTYTSAATMSAGSNSSTATVVINETNYAAIKCGTGTKAGVATVSIPSGTTKLHVHIAGWNGENGKTVDVTTSAGTVSKINNVSTTSLITTADTGVKNSSPFTLAGTSILSTSYYYVIDLTSVSTAATITFTAHESSSNRFVIWGCNAE